MSISLVDALRQIDTSTSSRYLPIPIGEDQDTQELVFQSFAKDYSDKILAIDVNINTTEAPDPADRAVMATTRIYDTANPDLEIARNRKAEIVLGSDAKRAQDDASRNGFGLVPLFSEAANFYSGGFWDLDAVPFEAVFTVRDIVGNAITMIAVSMNSSAIAMLGTIISIAALIPSFMLIVRRLHDLNRPAWWCVGVFVPLVNLVLGIYLLFFKGTDGPNDYGPDPLEVPGGLL